MTTINKILRKKNKEPFIWLAIRLTHLSLESLGINRHTSNIMVASKGYICCATDNLCERGIERGMPSSTAQLLHKVDDDIPCRTYERELDSEKKILEALCEALYNFTPHIEIYRVPTHEGAEDIGVALELSRCIKLFKGLPTLCEHIFDVLKQQRLSYHYAQAHTKKMAWLLSYKQCTDTENKINQEHKHKDFINQLSHLSLDYAYEFSDTVASLKKTGFFTFSDITQQIQEESLHSLRTRFGDAFFEYLAEVYDIDTGLTQGSLFQTPARLYTPKKIFIESIQFEHPISSCEQLQHPVKKLLNDLTCELVKTQAQTQTIFWHLYDIYHNQEHFSIRLERLHRNPQLAEELTMIQFENQPLPFEIDVLELRCERIFPVHFENTSIDNNYNGIQEHELATVVAKLNARLGDKAVFTLSPKDSHIPELSYHKTPLTHDVEKHTESKTYTSKIQRPSWIFNVPVKVGKRQNELFWKGKLELLQGPERIEGLWWKKPTGRDYFVAKRDDNVRLWVFHDLYKNEWFAHGVFA